MERYYRDVATTSAARRQAREQNAAADWPSIQRVAYHFLFMFRRPARQRGLALGLLLLLSGPRRSCIPFVMESVFLAPLAGAIGCLLALPMNGLSAGTAQTRSFTGMVFAALMGLVGGLLPALRAARMPITRALRDA